MSTPNTLPIIEGVALLALVTAFGVILKWLVTTLTVAIKDLKKALNINSIILLNLQKQLLAHDLTVSGLNPSTGESFEERDSKTLVKYKEMQKELDNLVKLLESRKND